MKMTIPCVHIILKSEKGPSVLRFLCPTHPPVPKNYNPSVTPPPATPNIYNGRAHHPRRGRATRQDGPAYPFPPVYLVVRIRQSVCFPKQGAGYRRICKSKSQGTDL